MEERPTARIVPPSCRNFSSCGPVFDAVYAPTIGSNSAGIREADPAAPPRPSAADGPTPDGKMMTSYLVDRLPASSALGKTTSNGNSCCSRSQRVQPDGIEPPY